MRYRTPQARRQAGKWHQTLLQGTTHLLEACVGTHLLHAQASTGAPPRQEVHTPFTVVYLVNKRFLHGAPMLVKDL